MKKPSIDGRWLTYGIVALMGIVGTIIDSFSDFPLVEKYIPNINSEILGIFVTVALIENLLRLEAKKRAKRVRGVALKKLKTPLSKIVDLFAQMIKASTKEKPKNEPISFVEMFSRNDLYLALHNLNLGSAAPIVPKQNWYEYSHHTLNSSLQKIEDVMMGYMEYFTSEEIERVETLEQSPLVLMLKGIVNVPTVLKGDGHDFNLPLLGTFDGEQIKTELDKLNQVIEIVGGIQVPDSFWTNTVSPKIGESWMESLPRINLK